MELAQAVTSVLMLCVFLLIGVPLWWNTTKVFRASLPYAQIDQLRTQVKTIRIGMSVFTESESAIPDDMLQDIKSKLATYTSTADMQLDAHINKQHLPTAILSLTNNELCTHLSRNRTDMLHYSFVLRTSSKRSVYICEQTLVALINYEAEQIPADTLLELMTRLIRLNTARSCTTSERKSSHRRQMAAAPGYQIAFTLAVADPVSVLPSWDIEEAIDNHLQPLLQKLNFLGPFNISSQVLYFTEVGVRPRQEYGTYYYLTSKLPQLINPLESRLGSHVSNNPVLNFVVYVPPLEHTPLFIRESREHPSEGTGFHAPRWGGLLFHNSISNKSHAADLEKPVRTRVDSRLMMQTFVSQFKLLFGLQVEEDSASLGLCEWERQQLLLSRSIEQIQSSISTLCSLTELLDKVENIVIREDIALLADRSVRAVSQSIEFLSKGEVEKAFAASKSAFIDSEKAFFDSSLLELLYFPSDQVYAIYVPLFLPISIPVVLAFLKAVKFFRGGQVKQKTE